MQSTWVVFSIVCGLGCADRSPEARADLDGALGLPVVAVPSSNAAAAPWTLTASDGSGLVVTRVDARAVLEGPLAFTELHLYFRNAEDRVREGTFAITLPTGAAVSRFAMEDAGRWMEAEVVETQLARRVYEDFLRRRQDPALLEKAMGNQFSARVFPIAARADKHLVIAFSQTLAGQTYTLPLRGLPQVERVDVRLDAKAQPQVLTERNWTPDRDFIADAHSGVTAVTADLHGGSIIAAEVTLEADVARTDPPAGVTILVDTSASRGLGYAKYVRSIHDLVTALGERYGADVTVVAFDQDTRVVHTGRAVDWTDVDDAILHARGAAGASDLGQALAWVATRARADRIVVVTDGVMTAGPDGAVLKAQLAAASIARLDVVLVGGIRDANLADALVTAGARVGAVLDLDAGAPTVAAQLAEPALVNVTIEVPGASWSSPRVIANARPGSRVMVYARLPRVAKPGELAIVVAGRRHTVTSGPGTAVLVERAVAAAEIAERERALETATPEVAVELRAEIVKRSVAARVVSSQTAMLVLESDAEYIRYGIDRRSLGDILVVGSRGVERVGYESAGTRKTATTDEALDPVIGADIASGTALQLVEGRMQVRSANPDTARQQAIEQARSVGILGHRSLIQGGSFASLRGFTEAGAEPDADAVPQALEGKLAAVMTALAAKRVDHALALARAWHTTAPGDVLALVALGEALEAKHELAAAARIYGSIIDLYPSRADFRRFAGERLERIGKSGRRLAIDTYRRAIAQRPDHLTGHRLLAYALLRDGDHAGAFAAILAGLGQPSRRGIYAGADRVLVEDAGMVGAVYLAQVPAQRSAIIAALDAHGATLASGPSTRFVLYWETDANDVDFHIRDARGGHAFYQDTELASGGALYADVTTGYGPECFAISGTPQAGPYTLSAHYYARGPMGYGMGLLQIQRYDGNGAMSFEDRPYVIMTDGAFVELGTAL